MSELTFDKLYTTSDNSQDNCIGNEPDNTLARFYIEAQRQCNMLCAVHLSDYGDLNWQYAPSVLTSQAITNIGIKTFPQIGAIGFYSLKFENRSIILAPIFTKNANYKAPTIDIEDLDDALRITITPPKDALFDCYRVSLRNGYFAEEYVTYETVFVVPKPTAGMYTVYVVGYIDERLASREGSYEGSVVVGATVISSYGITGRSKPDQISADSFGAPVVVQSGYQKYAVKETGSYFFEVMGGAGGKGCGLSYAMGGFAAILTGTFNLSAGDELYMLVGQKGTDHPSTSKIDGTSGAGGGMTVVAIKDAASTDILKFPASMPWALNSSKYYLYYYRGDGKAYLLVFFSSFELTSDGFNLYANEDKTGVPYYCQFTEDEKYIEGSYTTFATSYTLGPPRIWVRTDCQEIVTQIETLGYVMTEGLVPRPTDGSPVDVPVRLLMCAGGGNGGMDEKYASGRRTADALLTEGTSDAYLTTSRSGGGYRNSNTGASYCGQSFLNGGEAATTDFSRSGTSSPGFGGGGRNDDDGFGGGGGGYRGGIPSSDIGGSSYNACPTGTTELASTRTDGHIKILKC